MLKVYNEQEMLDYWKMRLGLADLTGSLHVKRHNGAALEAKLLSDIRAWYADLLYTAPAEKLPITDMTAEATASYVDDTAIEVVLPPRAVRVVSVELDGWGAPLSDFVSSNSTTGRRQLNPLTRNGRWHPVGVLYPGRMRLYGVIPRHEWEGLLAGQNPLTPTPLTRLRVIATPADTSFALDESLLLTATLPIN